MRVWRWYPSMSLFRSDSGEKRKGMHISLKIFTRANKAVICLWWLLFFFLIIRWKLWDILSVSDKSIQQPIAWMFTYVYLCVDTHISVCMIKRNAWFFLLLAADTWGIWSILCTAFFKVMLNLFTHNFLIRPRILFSLLAEKRESDRTRHVI